MSKKSNSELVPVWKVHGFTQSSGSKAKEATDLKNARKIEHLHIHADQIPFKWPMVEQKKTQEQRVPWEKKLMHRSRSFQM